MNKLLSLGVIFLFTCSLVKAEGSKNLTPQGSGSANLSNLFIGWLQHDDASRSDDFLKPGAPDDQKMYVYLKAGETLYYGLRRVETNDTGVDHGDLVLRLFRSDTDVEVNTNTLVAETGVDNDANFLSGIGVIEDRDEVNAGPSAVVGASGYNAISYTNNTGVDQDFYVVFDQQSPGLNKKSWYDLWDFSVFNGTEEQSGRLHARTWSFTSGSGSGRFSTAFELFAAVPTVINGVAGGYFIKAIDLGGIQPFGLLVYANSTGSDISGATDLNGDGIVDFLDARRTQDDDDDVTSEYEIFIDNPDLTLYPTSELPSVEITNAVFFCAANGDGNAVIGFNTNQVGEVAVIVDLNGASGYQAGTTDVIIEEQISTEGSHEIYWDGLDGLGTPVPTGTTISISGRFTSGPTHFPLFDIEDNNFSSADNAAGISVRDVRPTTSFDLIYWDDRSVDIQSDPEVELNGTNEADHFWDDGDEELVNTWSYGYYQINSQTVNFDFICDGDSDTINNTGDADSDNDGISDEEEGDFKNDTDGDGVPDYVDPDLAGFVDENNDGINDNFDVDQDGIPNALDKDSDNDGIPDVIEAGYVDADNDGEMDCTAGTASAFDVSLTVTDNGGNSAIDNGLVYISTTSSSFDVSGSTIGTFVSTDFYMEAECAAVGANWTSVVDGTASNGQYAVYTGTGSNDNPPADVAGNYVRFTFTVTTAGVYEVYSRTDTDNNGANDSYWVRVDDGSFVRFNSFNSADGFLWDQVYDSDNGDALQSYSLDIGTHTVDFAYRENGTKLDQVLVSLSTSVSGADPAGSAFNCNAFPTSDIQVTSSLGTAPFTVDFDGTGSSDSDGTVDTYNWDFGDGSTSMSATPQNIFTINGGDSDNDGNGQCDVAQDPNFIIPNKDGDALADYLDLDSDNDGIVDVIEAGGEADPTTGQINEFVDTNNDGLNDLLEIDPLDRDDFDNDGLPNYLDIDADNDGIRDYIEAQSSDAFIDIALTDTDANGIPDVYDPTNGGTFLDPVNTDVSGEPDYIDLDADEDGVADVVEGHDADFDGFGDWDATGSNNDITDEPAYLTDNDEDGLLDIFDTDDGGTTAPIQNTDRADKRDWQDTDDDNDGQPTLGEDTNGNGDLADDFTQGQGGSPTTPDYLFRGDYDGDAIPDRLDADSDNDGILDSDEDNGEILDPGSDVDDDGIPNYRDADQGASLSSSADINSDGVFDVYDSDLDGTPDFLDLDSDNDGILDGVEANAGAVPFGFNQTTGQFNLQDPDNDGLMNYVDADDVTRNTKVDAVSDLSNEDTDADGILDYLDIDSDNDGITDNVEAQTSAGYIDVVTDDTNGNGIYDVYDADNGGTFIVPVNTDTQDLQDYRDTDSDNDGFLDIVEGDDADNDGRGKWDDNQDGIIDDNEDLFIDTNGNGIPDGADADPVIQICTDANMDGICDSAQNDTDTDGDFIEDAFDPDDDNDGLQDAFDTIDLIAMGLGNSAGSNADLQNTDGTDQPDWRDTDDDNDDLLSSTEDGPDGIVPIPDYLSLNDFDGDGVDDVSDQDSDNDGVPDSQEGGTAGVDPSGDDDADGIFNFRDSDIPGFVDSNSDGVDDRGDKDLDGIPDFHDLDADNDGIPDAVEANKGVLPANMNNNGEYPTAYISVNDTDGDGLANDVDIDNGGESLPTLDTDGDGLLDFLDLDADDDGLPDISEVGGVDSDGDGKVDDLTDADSDGLPDLVDSDSGGTPFTIVDADGDLVPDFTDVDSDNDGVTDPIENGQPDTDGNGKIDQFSNDADNDGLADRVDPDSGGTPITKLDGDGDTIPNYQDLDSDNDALSDIFEADGVDTDNDGRSDELLDTDDDGIPDSADNTQTAVGDADADEIDDNADADIDGDGVPNNYDEDIVASGDADGDDIIDTGDVDIDGDGIKNRFDVDQTLGVDGNTNGIDDTFDVAVTAGTDANGDGIDDALYVEDDANGDGIDDSGFIDIDADKDGIRDSQDPDANGNGLDDELEAEPLPVQDTDQDGFENYRDLDADNDGIVDVIEIGLSAESGTGRIDGFAANDGDGSGWHDTYEGAGNAVTPSNSDVGGVSYTNPADYLDIDADNDGIPDNFEAQTKSTYIVPVEGDTDGDGLLDVYDPDNGGSLIDPVNTDGDGGPTPDYLDDDSDDDNVPDDVEGDNADKSQFADWDTGSNNLTSDETGFEVDVDSDGLWDIFDEYPGTGISNVIGTLSAIQDTDRDQQWDFQDVDDDNDGKNTSSQGAAATNEDTNSDGDPTNDFDDDDDNIIPNYLFGRVDRDGDTINDDVDLDSDNDGLRDTDEDGGTGIDPSGDIDGDGLANYEDPDMDGDGTINRLDSDVDDPADSSADGLSVEDENGDGVFDIFDKDRDGVPDFLDIDADNDGIADLIENGLADANGDGTLDEGSGITDANGNGLDDAYDGQLNAVSAVEATATVTNAGNASGGDDGVEAIIGNNAAITLDFGEQIPQNNVVTINLRKESLGGVDPTYSIEYSVDDASYTSATTGTFLDGDVSADNTVEITLTVSTARYVRITKTNVADRDIAIDFATTMISGDFLTTINTDADGLDNYLDLDSDNDGIADIVEAQSTAGYIAPVLTDANLNGRMDVFDATPIDPINTDSPSDALPDYLDTDSDEDGIPDNIEGFDGNSDGLADWDTDDNNDVSDEAGFTNDVDNDGILFVYDSNNGIGTLANINDGTNASLQDTDQALDADSPDWRDADDDNDGIDTDVEDVADGANLPADFTQGGITIPDYLFNPDKDGDNIIDDVDLDSDNDGILNTEEYDGATYNTGGDPFDDDDADGLFNYLDTSDPNHEDANGDGVDDRVDKDRDGIPNFFDLDSDNDGVLDAIEANGGTVPTGFDTATGRFGVDNSGGDDDDDNDNGLNDNVEASGINPANSDMDGPDDYLDLDSDNDGITDHVEAQTTAAYSAPSGDDADGDGLDDTFDGDNGGTAIVPTNTDSPGDALPDYLDTDSDNDIGATVLDPGELGIGDIIEGFDANRNGFSELDSDLDGMLSDEVGYNVDSDDDGIWDLFDSFSGFGAANILGSNADLQDTDGDGTLDWRDLDDDNDLKVSDDEDVDGDGVWTNDKDQAGGATPDYLFFNDTDQDNIPDGIDADADNDGIPDKDEQLDDSLPLPLDNEDGDSFFNYIDSDLPGFTDSNGDNINDAYDFDLDGVPNALDLDSDNDGIPDAVEANTGVLPTGADANGQFPENATDVDDDGLAADVDSDDNDDSAFDTTLPIPDTDGDGNPDFLDIDADNDGIVDLVEGGGTDSNGDGQFDILEDTDGDGLDNKVDSDNSGTPLTLPNTDGTDGPDYIDTNSDDDSLLDFDEGFDDDEDGDATSAGEDYEARATAYGDAGKYDPADLSWLNDFLTFGSPNYYDTDGDGLIDLFDPDNGGNWYGNVSGIPDNDSNGTPNVTDDNGLDILTAPGDVMLNLGLWLKADAGTTIATGVSAWADQSGNGLSADQATADDQPALNADQVNGNPAIRFSTDGPNDFLDLGDELDLTPGVDTWSAFFVYNVAVGEEGTLLSRAGNNAGGRQYQFGIFQNEYFNYSGGTFNSAATTTSTGNWAISSTVTSTTEALDYLAGNLDQTGAVGGATNSENVLIGARSAGGGFNLDGDIAEIVFYTNGLGDTDRESVESYLAIKYGLTLTHNYILGATTLYDVGTFPNDIAGIGQDDSQGLDQTASTSESGNGILSISAATSQDDRDFLIWGTNGGVGTDLTGDYNNGITTPTDNGSARLWKVTQTGDIGTVTLTIDGAAIPSEVTHLIIDDNDDLSSPEQIIELTGSSSPYTIAGVDFTDDATSYFSFIGFPEISVVGNGLSITDGDVTPDVSDDTNFGSTDVGAGSLVNTFTISNTGNAALNISSIDISGSSDFSTPALSTSLAAGATLDFDVTFDPSSAGSITSTVTINSDDQDETAFTFDVNGLGSSLPEINLLGNAVAISNGETNFGLGDNREFGDTDGSVALSFTIENLGSSALTLTQNPTISGSVFSVTSNPSSLTIGAASTDVFTVTFSPGASFGLFAETVTILSDDTDEGTYTFTITGLNLPEPGAVTSPLGLWLRADVGTTIGTGLSLWEDQSGNDNDASQVITDDQPPLTTNFINSNPAVVFDDNSDQLDGTGGFYTEEYFVVIEPDVAINGSANGFVVGFESGKFGGFYLGDQTDGFIGPNERVVHATGDSGDSDVFRAGLETGTLSPTSIPVIFSVRNNLAASAQEIGLNGTSLTVDNSQTGNPLLNLSDQNYRVGDNFLNSNPFNGGIAEIISYEDRLGNSDREDVESYLAIKYAITLSHDYTFGATTVYDVSTFGADIAGIGQADSQGLDQLSSLSESGSGLLTIGGASSQDDGEFLVWGTNAATGTDLTGDYNNGVATGTDNGSARIWKVTQTGDIGTVDLTIDGGSLPTGISHLIIDDNDDLSSPEQVIELTGGSSPYTISGVDFTDDATSYFSFIGIAEITVAGNAVNIDDGDMSPSLTDDTQFGAVNVSSGNQINTFTITNTGSGSLDIASVNITGSTDFSTPVLVTSLAAGASTTFDVTFDPSSLGTITATITINSNDDDEAAFDFVVQGSGADLAEINIQGNSIDIANGETSTGLGDDRDFGDSDIVVDRTFAIQNLGASTLTLSGTPIVSISGDSQFSILTQPSSSSIVNGGGDLTFVVRFDPASNDGTFSATVSIDNNDTNEDPHTFTVNGSNIPFPGDFATNLTLWLKAGEGTRRSSGDVINGEIDEWLDQSTAGNDVTATDRPNLQTIDTAFNFNKYLSFDEDALGGSSPMGLNSDGTVFFVGRKNTNNGFDAGVGFGPSGLDPYLGTNPDDDWRLFQTGGTPIAFDHGTTVNLDQIYIFGAKWTNGTDAVDTELRLIGESSLSSVMDLSTGQEITIGTDTGGDDWDGDIAEVIVYTERLGDTEVQRIESYLAIKYGLTLNNSNDYIANTLATTNTILLDYSGAGTFVNDIAGIGRDNNQGLNQTSSKSVNTGAVLIVSNATSQDDGDFLLWSHNGGSATALTGDYNGETNNGLPRIWRVEETGDIGTVTITVDQSDVESTINAIYVNNADNTLGTGGQVLGLTDDGNGNWTVDLDLDDDDYFSFINSSEPNIRVLGNGQLIADGDVTPSTTDDTDFTETAVGATISNTFTISNIGSADLTLENTFVDITGAGSSAFSVQVQPASPVASSGSVTFTIDFTPGSVAVFDATVAIDSDDPDTDPYTFSITGEGTTSSEMDVFGLSVEIASGDASPSVVDDTNFGSLEVSQTSTKTYTIENNGSASLSLSGVPVVSLSGATTHFSVTIQPSASIASGANETFSIQYSPLAAGIHQVVVSIDNDDPNESPYTFAIQGSATEEGGGSSGVFSCNCVAGSSDITVSNSVVLNDYFPGNADALSGTQTITLGARRAGGAGTTLAVGDLLLMMQMQGAELNSSLPDAATNSIYGDGAGGNDRAGFVETEDFTAGQYEYVVITDASGYDESTGGTIEVKLPVVNSYKHQITQASFSDDLGRQTFQLIKVANYLNVTVESSGNITTVPWNGRSGGVIVMDALTSLTLNGGINADGLGFRGGLRTSANLTANNFSPEVGYRGEGYAGTPSGSHGYNNPPLAGGSLAAFSLPVAEAPGYPGGTATLDTDEDLGGTGTRTFTYTADRGHGGPGNAGGAGRYDGSGGGGGAGNAGGSGSYPNDGGIEDGSGIEPDDEFPNQGIGGGAKDIENGARAFLGGGGGSGGWDDETNYSQAVASGQPGGGVIIIRANNFTGTGSITADGEDGGTQGGEGAGGGGAGGSVIIVTDTEDLGSIILLSSEGGDGSSTDEANDAGGGGGSGGEIIVIRRGGAISDVPATVRVDGGAAGSSGAGAGVANGGSGGFETTSLPPSANLDCPLINVPDAAPGGVQGLLVWIKADEDVTFDGDNEVSQWVDQSSSAFVFDSDANGQLTTVGSTPNYSPDLEGFNFNPAIDFNAGGTGDYLGFTGFSNFSNTALDVFAVSSTAFTTDDQTILSFKDDSDADADDNDYNLELSAGGDITQRNDDGTVEGTTTTSTEIRDGRARIVNTRYVDGGDDTEIFVNNGSLVDQDNGFDVSLNTGLSDGTLVLGQDLDNLDDGGFATDEAFVGQIGEVIIYPTDLNDNERSRVDTYLGIKYGITLAQDQDYLNSFSEVIFPGSTETVYDNNIAGVGRDDASGLTQLQSKSINANTILMGSSDNFSTDRSFVVWGSNGVASPSFASTSGGAPSAATDTLDLQWKAYVSGTPGPIDMEFDLTGITDQPEATDVIAILIDEDLDGDFTTGTIRVEPYDNYDFGSGIASFSDIGFNDGEPFTLGVLPKAPGGVSANLTMWNKADAGTKNGGLDITSGLVDEWEDQSQSLNDVTGTELPTLNGASEDFNFNPSIDFSAQGHLFGSSPMSANSDGASFLVGSKVDNSGFDIGIGFDDVGTTGTDPAIGTFDDNMIFRDDDSSPGNLLNPKTLTTDMANIYGARWTNGTNQNVEVRVDGDGNISPAIDPSTGTDVHIGAESNGGASRWNGSISEVVVYDEELSDEDLQKVESYLAVKYGVTLDQMVNRDYVAANGSVIFPASSSLPDYITYANDIFGIARDDQSDLTQPKSTSINDGTILTLTNGNDPVNPGSFSSNGTFLMVGNDQDDNGVIEEVTSDIPSNVTARLDREWRAAVTGNLGEITLQFDLGDLNGVAEAGGFSNFDARSVADFKVLVDKDGDFTDGFVQSFDATSYDPGTGIVTITGVTLADDDIFTLSTAIPAKGPGGVTAGLQLWLRADVGAYQDTGAATDADMDGDQVFRWDDQVSAQEYTNGGFGANSSPTFRTDVEGFNFNPAIQFVNDGTVGNDDYLANATSNIWGSDLTLLGVFQTDGDDGTVFSYDNDPTDSDDQFALNNLSGVELEVGENTLTDFDDANIADNQTRLFAFDYSDATDNYNLFIDGAADPDNSGTLGGTVTIPDGGTAVIGQDINDDSSGDFVTGAAGPGYDDFIGEMIVYDRVLTETERQQVQTYLGLKYGIFVDDGNPDFLSADGTVIYPGGESVFSNDIAGVGRDDLGEFIQSKSKSNESSATLTVEKNEDFNADGQYIVWAHNGINSGDSTTVGLPSGIESRKARVWRFDLTNSPTGTVDITLSLGGNPADFRLLFDAFDPTFGSASVINPTVTDNMDGTYTFENVSVSNFTDGGYFTIGSVDEDETPLPVELLYFMGNQEAETIELTWATATEINNDHFEVERSVDGQTWEVIGIVEGFGTTNAQQDYVFTDIDPEIGVAYYRLRQVDFDGAFEHSEIIQFNYRFEDFEFSFYPNPFEQFFTISIKGLTANERMPYRIVDLAGNLIQEGIFVANDNGRVRRDASITGNVAAGIYLFHIIRNDQPVIYKLIKK